MKQREPSQNEAAPDFFVYTSPGIPYNRHNKERGLRHV